MSLGLTMMRTARPGTARGRVRRLVSTVLVGGLLAGGLTVIAGVQATTAVAASDPCAVGSNPIVCENSKPGTPQSVWDVDGSGDDTIQGFATDMSVNVGSTESFKITSPGKYTMDIYRLGYYQGDGARLITSLTPTQQNQPACASDASTHLLDCGNWALSASWAVPATAVSGVYIAMLTRTDTGGESHIPFVIRNDASTSTILMQTSDTTWQAYNNYGGDTHFDGGANFYGGTSWDSANRAYKLSYNRPFSTRSWQGGRDYLFANEYPMIRFLEENGYDVSYFSGIDTSRNGAELKQHKVFLTAGHDEYWDTVQRANVTAARDAGVNLAFFTGNDDYWKTRWESSTAGTSTPYRTLVSYKETWSNGKIDPSSLWTGTWRDPRFTPPADGNQFENSLGGTAFMSNATDLPVTVSSAEGKLRIWRNTSLTSLAAGASADLAPHTVGYESNEDLDNGFRPAGLIDMSTSVGPSASYLQDFGTNVAAGTTTHHITLYKAPSGALVFSSGSIQWAWGLDADHDGTKSAADPRMQQATVNLLADMSAQPQTLMSGLVAATKSTDTTAPTSTITSPASGASIPNGTQVTVTGTATDAGGVVGGVEVSVDGSTWHPAVGRGTWSYTFIAHGSGPIAIRSRATDDSANTETPSAGVTVNENCPCSLFGNAVPKTADSGDTSDVELGVSFIPNTDGFISGVRFYKSAGNVGTHVGTLWSATGTPLATGTFLAESASGWQTMTFTNAVAVTKNTKYVVSYRAPKGHYAADSYAFSLSDLISGPLTAPRSFGTAGNGLYSDGGIFPSSTYLDENYYVDAVFTATNSTPPSVTSPSPRPGQVGVATNSAVTAIFSTPITTGSAQVSVKTSGGTTVAGATTYDATSRTLTFTPGSALAPSTGYTVTVSGATSSTGVTMASYSWSFTTDSSAACPCSLFGSTSTPVTADSGDTSSVELGLRFSTKVTGTVTGVRFYKAAGNTGTHTGTLWSPTGTALTTGTFSNETASGWQTLNFTSPVSVTPGNVYTISYHAPVGHYSADSSYFTADYSSGDLTAPVAGGNGVYTYGSGGTVPTTSFGGTNYWVDPLFASGNVAPSVISTTPAGGATGVSLAATVAATFSVALSSGTATLAVTGPGTTAVAGTTALSSDGTALTFTPNAPLVAGTTYSATVSGAKSTAGIAMAAPVTWSFSTSAPTTCPCTLFGSTVPASADSGDASSVELGVKVTPSVSGYITGVKFYKSAANTGTHTGTLWSSTGSVLATGTFVSETASGWQTLTFASPVAVTAGTTYTASYLAPVGHYAATANYFATAYTSGPLVSPATNNGVYAYGSGATPPTNVYQATNYWVDVVFNTTAVIQPRVVSTTPVNGSTAVPVSVSPTATFAAAIDSSTIVASITAAGGSPVAVSASYDATGKTVTVNPTAALTPNTVYAVSVKANDSAGNTMPSPATWQFTTAGSDSCPCTLFGSTAPASADSGDTGSVELGVKVTPSVSGYITGVKFYKSAANTGTHTGTLWSSTGSVLATGTFVSETASGWQTLTFASPVAVTAGTTYTASYLAPVGHYAATGNYFSTAYTSGPLTAPATNNGVYAYGAGSTPPANTYLATNYWVDVVFSGTATGTGTGTGTTDTQAPVISAVSVTGSDATSATVKWTTDEASSSVVAYGTSATALTSTATGGTSTTAHSVSLTGLTAATRYYYRVTSVDAAGNSATSPASTAAAAQYAPAVTPASQTSTADFTAGTLSNAYVSPRSGGDVTLAPAVTQEFTAASVPATWSSTSLATGSSVAVASGVATVSGRLFRTTATYSTSRQVDGIVTFQPVSGQWFGATDGGFTGTTTHWATFRTTTTGGLVAETKNGNLGVTTTNLSSSLLGSSHRYAVDWTSTATIFTVDGTTVATQSRGITAAMYAAVQDSTQDANPVLLDSIWITPYAASGTFSSSVIDAGATVDWGVLTPTATVPSGTTITYQVRTGPTATAGGTGWSAWTTVAAGGDVPGSQRYLQYQAALSSSSVRNTAPTLSAVQIGYAVQ